MSTIDLSQLSSARSYALLGLLAVLSFGLRFYDLGNNPPGFFRDEADKGYTSYSLLQTGKDQAGRSWPLFVRSLSVTTSALYQYLDIPCIAALGMTETAVRLPACLAGTLSVLVVFVLAQRWWGNSIALGAGLFVALSPWSLLLSRWANQSIGLTVFVPLGVLFFARNVEKQFASLRDVFLSALCFLAALYTYEPAQLFVPVFVSLLWLVSGSRESFAVERRFYYVRSLVLFFLLFAIGSIPLGHHLLFEPAQSAARFNRISIFDGRPFPAIAGEWFRNYLLHLSPGFLFVHGDANPRHHLFLGQENLCLAPLVLIGLLRAFTRRSLTDRILLVWFFCFPIAAACTRENIPHALRSIFAVPIIPLSAACGLAALLDWKSRLESLTSPATLRILAGGGVCVWVLSVWLYVYYLFGIYPAVTPMMWEYGYRQAISWWQQQRQPNDRLIVSGVAEYPYIFFLFYDRYPPELWQRDNRIEGITFIPYGQSIEPYFKNEDQRTFYLVRPFELPNLQPEKVILTPRREAVWKWIVSGNEKKN